MSRASRVSRHAGTIALALAFTPVMPVVAQPEAGRDKQPDPPALSATTKAASRKAVSPLTEAQSTVRERARVEAPNAPTSAPATNPETEVEVAVDEKPDFTVIINTSNPTVRLPRKSVAKLFLKKIKKWDDWDQSVKPVNQKADSEQRSQFTGAIHGMRVGSITEFWLRMIFSGRGAPPEELSGDQAVVAFVAKNPGAIGYVSTSATLDTRVKPLIITD